MPLKKKKIVSTVEIEESSDESCNDSDSDDDDVYKGNEEIQVDFEGRNPIDSDFHGIRQLLKQLFLKASINLSELTDLIIGQNYIGSVVTQTNVSEDDEDDDDMDDSNMIFGITTAVNISHKLECECIQQIRSYILEKCEQYAASNSVKILFRDALTNPSKIIGFLINERFVNIPVQISIPLLENLHKEIQKAQRKNMPYNFVHFLMIIKFHRKVIKKNKSTENIYSNEEEETMCEDAFGSFEYSVKNEIDSCVDGEAMDTDNRLTPYRKIILFDANKLPHLITSIKQLIQQ